MFAHAPGMHRLLRRVVVTGIGSVNPLGRSFPSSWSVLTDGYRINDNHKDDANDVGITTFERALLAQDLAADCLDRELRLSRSLPCQVAAPVRGVDRGDGRTARFVQFALMAGMEAARSAGLDRWLGLGGGGGDNHERGDVDVDMDVDVDVDGDEDEELGLRRDRSGVSIGSGMSSVREIADSSALCHAQSSIRRLGPHFVPKVLSNSASGRLSLALGLRGPNLSCATACAAGAHSIGNAYRCIQLGDADVMLAGGAEACVDPVSAAGFCRLRALSSGCNDRPRESSRPFDSKRDGFVMAEGAAVLVLEDLDVARSRGATILCEMVGYGASGDAHHITSPDSEGRGAIRAMEAAIRSSGLAAGGVDYVNAHATSTPAGDDVEARAIDAVFFRSAAAAAGGRERDLYVSSTKGATGHLLGAAGAIEAAFSAMSVAEGTVPHTANLSLEGEGATNFGFCHVFGEAMREMDVRVAMSNSFGFGGTNASLIFSRYDGDSDAKP